MGMKVLEKKFPEMKPPHVKLTLFTHPVDFTPPATGKDNAKERLKKAEAGKIEYL